MPTYNHSWKNTRSKTPHHLRFGTNGRLQYMRDGIILTSNGFSGSYLRTREFAGENRDEHFVIIMIECKIFDEDQEIVAL